MKALIVHSRRTGLGIIRSLGQKGVKILTADTFNAPGFYSKYTSKSYIIPNMLAEGEAMLIRKLIEIGKENNGSEEKIALYTGSDDYLTSFCKNWALLTPFFYATFETDFQRLKSCLEKGQMYYLAEKAKVPIPKSYYNIDDARIVEEFPVIIKPSVKKTDKIDVVKEAFRIRKCENEQTLQMAINLLKNLDVEFVVQQFIPGGDDSLYTAGIFSFKGKLTAIACGRKIRQFPPELGECSFGELLTSPQIEEYAEALCAVSGITGICQIEFKKYNNEYFLMEINPRPWSWNSLMTYAGVNLPYIAYQAVSGLVASDVHRAQKLKGRWMYITRDFKYNVKNNNNISFFQFIKDVFTAEDYAVWSLRDPIPFFVDFYYFLKFD